MYQRVTCLSRLNFDSSLAKITQRGFSTTTRLLRKPMPPRPTLTENEIEEAFLKGSGPGGQKINKTSSAVQLKHLPTGLVVKSQETRSRTQNRKIARRLLAERLERIQLGDQSRTAIKAQAASKRKASADKKKRRKYRSLQDGEFAISTEDNYDEFDNDDALNATRPCGTLAIADDASEEARLEAEQIRDSRGSEHRVWTNDQQYKGKRDMNDKG